MTFVEAKPISALRSYSDSVESAALDSLGFDAFKRARRQGVSHEQAFNDMQKDFGGFTRMLGESIADRAKVAGVEVTLQAAELRAVTLMGKNMLERASFLKAEASENIGSRVDLYREPVAKWVTNDRDGAEAFVLHCHEVEKYLQKNVTAGDRGGMAEITGLHKMLSDVAFVRSSVENHLTVAADSDNVKNRVRLAG